MMLFLTLAALFGVALVSLVAIPAATSSAQTTRLQVTEVKPVQVIEDVPMVVGKATVLKVSITAGASTQAKLDVTFGASRKVSTVRLVKGANTLYVPVDPPGAPGSINVIAHITSVSGAGGNQITRTAQVAALKRDHIKLLLLPVDWSDQDRARYLPTTYNNFVRDSGDFLRATYPFPDGNSQVNSTTQNHMLNTQQRAIVDSIGNIDWTNITNMYLSIGLAGRQVQGDADLVVGVLPPKWFARNMNDPTVVGLEIQAMSQVVANQVDSDYATLAHEVGHTFGRIDEYDFTLSPPKIGDRLDSPGYWIAKSRAIPPSGRTIYYSFMGASDPASQYWIDKSTYMALIEALQK